MIQQRGKETDEKKRSEEDAARVSWKLDEENLLGEGEVEIISEDIIMRMKGPKYGPRYEQFPDEFKQYEHEIKRLAAKKEQKDDSDEKPKEKCNTSTTSVISKFRYSIQESMNKQENKEEENLQEYFFHSKILEFAEHYFDEPTR